MQTRMILIVISIMVLFLVGCRTGEFNKVDLPIYEKMPGLLAADEYINNHTAKNEDSSIRVIFEKGEMSLWLREASDMDEDARMVTISNALTIYHDEYMNCAENVKKDGSFRRERIVIRGFVGDFELYVIEWVLTEDKPNLLDNRSGNYI